MQIMKSSTKNLCVLAMGIALYVVLSLCIQVPCISELLSLFGLCWYGSILLFVWSTQRTLVGFLGIIDRIP